MLVTFANQTRYSDTMNAQLYTAREFNTPTERIALNLFELRHNMVVQGFHRFKPIWTYFSHFLFRNWEKKAHLKILNDKKLFMFSNAFQWLISPVRTHPLFEVWTCLIQLPATELWCTFVSWRGCFYQIPLPQVGTYWLMKKSLTFP